ncbi:uncharacterized protein LOC109536931 [Dendroctonus ponderosae]|uniref:Globin domain-containing protein n=1 Tax=Dendroctonus ponderosae TaxID=77166 RepID=A0AAR5PDK2_DENPD|nr:uncharacterized protein LOC109536931 [Dendroctonus ponderosae]XP_048519645.1 uncharacterized protein LOC109536931 [Dendroctonus ponderosae]
MGIITSYFGRELERDDDPDPKTGLTSRDISVLKTTWKRITERGGTLEIGIAIFTNLFEKHPEYQQLFPFKNLRREELKTSNKFRAHCISVMYALTCIVENVSEPLILEQLLIKQSTSHVLRNVPDQAYWDIKTVILSIVASSMNPSEVFVWEKFLKFAFRIMVATAEETRNN